MIDITLTPPETLQLTGELQRQVPFALSVGINDALRGAQQAIRQRVMQTFIVRRKQWISQSIKITRFTTKRNLDAVLQVDPTRNVLGKFESGGIKTSFRAGGSVSVPVEVRPNPRSVIPGLLRPRAFRFQYAGKGPQATVFRGRDRTFLVRRGTAGAIFQRTGRGPQALKLLYVLTRQARIPASLQFKTTGLAAFRAHWPHAYRAALFRALRTAR